MISKELLSKVLDNEVPYQVKVHKIIIKNNSLNYFYNSKDSGGGLFEANEYINIYELAHKCKEWAKYDKLFGNSGYDLYTEHHRGTNYPSVMGEKPLNKNYNHYICFYNRHNIASSTIGQGITEPEAIFNACQWILDKDSK